MNLRWGSPLLSGGGVFRDESRATPPGTGDAFVANPVASLGSARPSQRAQRGGLATGAGLRYVLIPWETMLPRRGPIGRGVAGAREVILSAGSGSAAGDPVSPAGRTNAVMPLDVLGRTRATLTEPASSSLFERSG
jgi:hypothetical protein